MNTPCLICGSKNKKFLFIAKDRLHSLPGEFPVARCNNCGLMMLDPQPSMKEVGKYYPTKYHAYARYNPGTKQEKFAIFLYKLFFTKGKGNPLLKLLLLPFKHLLRGTDIVPGGKILDVGCGSGAFLYKMKAAGMKAYGVEFSKDGCKAAQQIGLDVKCGVLEQQRYPSNNFDIITLNHVFEHVPDPLHTLSELKRIIKLDGSIIIAIPNSSSLARLLFGRYWASLDSPRHLSIQNPSIMRLAAKKTGLKVKKVRYISFPFQFQGSLAYIINRNKQVPYEDTWIGKSRLLYWLFFPLVYLVDFLRLGDVIEVTLTR